VTAIGVDAFWGSKIATARVQNGLEICEYFVHITPPEVNVKNPALLPGEIRPSAAVGYARHPDEAGAERRAAHIAYIKANAAKLMEKALEYPELLRLMLEERLLIKRTAEKYLEAAAERKMTESVAMLLEYINSSFAAGKKRKLPLLQ